MLTPKAGAVTVPYSQDDGFKFRVDPVRKSREESGFLSGRGEGRANLTQQQDTSPLHVNSRCIVAVVLAEQ